MEKRSGKHVISTMFVLLLLLLGTILVTATYTVMAVQDGDYTFTVNGGVATITGYTGADGAITIPSTLGGYPIVATGNYAFSSYSLLTAMTIPNSVISIGFGVFWNCANLTSISFLGLVAPTTIGLQWIKNTDAGIRGHAYSASNFPAPGNVWNGLTIGAIIPAATVPGSPTNLTATPANAKVVLAWTAPADNGGSDITEYKLYRSTASGGTYTHIASPSGLTYTNTGLTKGQIYHYKVSAISSAGESALTEEVAATPIAPNPGGIDYAMLILIIVAVAAIGTVRAAMLYLPKKK